MTQPVQENTDDRDLSGLSWRTAQLARRPGVQIVGGIAIFEIKVFEDVIVVAAGDGAFKFDIPSDLDEAVLVDVEAWITGASSSGTVVVSLYNNTQGVDMLSTPLTIDVGELNDKDAATPFVIDLTNAEVAEGDEIWINVDNAGTGALGLGVAVKFTPSDNAAIIVRGTKGDPGGVTDFQGAWQDATSYQAGDVVSNNGVVYVATQDHTSNAANDEPGVGTNWEDFWVPMADVPLSAGATFTVVSASGAVPVGVKAAVVIPFPATITEAWVLADSAGNATIDFWKCDFGGYPPTIADSIGTLTLSGSIKNLDSTLSGWDTGLLEDDILVLYISGVTVITRLTVFLKLAK